MLERIYYHVSHDHMPEDVWHSVFKGKMPRSTFDRLWTAAMCRFHGI